MRLFCGFYCLVYAILPGAHHAWTQSRVNAIHLRYEPATISCQLVPLAFGIHIFLVHYSFRFLKPLPEQEPVWTQSLAFDVRRQIVYYPDRFAGPTRRITRRWSQRGIAFGFALSLGCFHIRDRVAQLGRWAAFPSKN